MAPVKAVCSECGREFQIPKKWAERVDIFCSPRCRSSFRMSHQYPRFKKKQAISTCKFCGKEFEGNRVFCSQECLKKYQEEKDKNEKVVGDITLTCKVCGKAFVVHKDKPVFPDTLPKCCSAECRKEASRLGGQKGARVTHANNVKRREERSDTKKREYLTNGLCAYCKTSYADCERMQTEFRVIPKGARFNRAGKIIECPKFKS